MAFPSGIPVRSIRESFAEGLTFDHDHVDIDGADQRLGKPFSSLQNVRDFSRRDHVIGFGTKGHQLPDRHPFK